MSSPSNRIRCCDGLSRRKLLGASLAGLVGLSLPNLLRLQAQSAELGASRRDTAVIYVLQEGGAPQHETWDPKPLAPPEVRGEFTAATSWASGCSWLAGSSSMA